MGESAPHRPGHPSAVGTPDRPVDRRCRCRRPHRRLLPLPLRRPGGPYLCGSGCPWPGLARQRTRVRRPLEALHHHSPRTVDPHRAHPGSGRTPCTGVRPRLTPSAATTPTTPWTLFVNTPLRDYAQRPRVNDFTLPVLGVDYIATYAAHRGFNVGVLDAEALGLSVADTVAAVNRARPRWVGFNLLARTYEISATIASGLAPDIKVMVGGHQAKAMPTQILTDERMARCAALVIGEAETRVAE